jgi:hypothetical protein
MLRDSRGMRGRQLGSAAYDARRARLLPQTMAVVEQQDARAAELFRLGRRRVDAERMAGRRGEEKLVVGNLFVLDVADRERYRKRQDGRVERPGPERPRPAWRSCLRARRR